MRDLRTLPKGHLHLHLDASVRRTTLAELAAEHDLPMPPLASYGAWEPFTAAFAHLIAILRTGTSILRVIEEAVADAAAEGVVTVEFSFSPEFYVPSFGSRDEVLAAFTETARTAGEKHGVAVGFIVTVNRTGTPELAMALALLATRWAGRGVWSFGLANDERGHYAETFVDAFTLARDAGLQITPHAGEFDGPQSVRACLDVLGAARIQHGVRSIEDPELVEELVARGICLDVCPSSNVQLGVVPSLAAHPLPALLAAGVRCSINADDPALFGPSILDEYELCRDELGLTDAQLAACALASVEASGAPASVKERARADVAAWLEGPLVDAA